MGILKKSTTKGMWISVIKYRIDDVTKNFFFLFQRFGYHVSVEHDEKHPQPKFGGNRFMGARDKGRMNT